MFVNDANLRKQRKKTHAFIAQLLILRVAIYTPAERCISKLCELGWKWAE